MSAKSDRFIVATYALWAGDFVFAEQLLEDSGASVGTGGDDIAEELMARMARRHLRQLRRRRAEFRTLAEEYSTRRVGRSLSGEPLVLETPHMRATVWREGVRTFRMQSYLRDLTWESALFQNVRREKQKSDSVSSMSIREARPWFGTGWIEVGSPLLEIEVTDLGQVEVL